MRRASITKLCLISASLAAAGCASRRPLPEPPKSAPAAARATASLPAPAPPELEALPLSPELFQGERPRFVSHEGPNGYFALPLPYRPAARLLAELKKIASEDLRTREEAHVTVVSPPEFHDVLSKRLTMREIEVIAHDAGLPRAEMNPVCLGRAKAMVQGKPEVVYFVVVRSEALREFRRDLAKRFVEKGGEPGAFVPERFDPHVTIGFTARDLHAEEDGVRKNAASCAYALSAED